MGCNCNKILYISIFFAITTHVDNLPGKRLYKSLKHSFWSNVKCLYEPKDDK